jgi:hypothetical protein
MWAVPGTGALPFPARRSTRDLHGQALRLVAPFAVAENVVLETGADSRSFVHERAIERRVPAGRRYGLAVDRVRGSGSSRSASNSA